jgi:hypothetical protein
MSEYESFFNLSRPVKILIHHSENSFFEGVAQVRSITDNRITLLLAEESSSHAAGISAGADVTVIADSGYSISRCPGRLESTVIGRLLRVTLTGKVTEKQQREYFRFDVKVPLLFSVPEDQTLIGVKNRWRELREQLQDAPLPEMAACSDGFRVVSWLDRENILPEHVNMSGGGLRFKMTDCLEPGTLINVQLFLPLVPTRVIAVVAEVLRRNELQLLWSRGVFYSTAMRFLCIDEKDRESLISFTLMEQRRTLREYREKGLFDRL